MFNLTLEQPIDDYENYILLYKYGYDDGLRDAKEVLALKEETKAKKAKEPKTWRNDYELYRKNLSDAYIALTKNKEWLDRKAEEYPNLDIVKTIRKACSDFWVTEEGWKNKKRKKTIEIDWLTTFAYCLDNKRNRVYKEIVVRDYKDDINSKVKARGVL